MQSSAVICARVCVILSNILFHKVVVKVRSNNSVADPEPVGDRIRVLVHIIGDHYYIFLV
jgi:hypothetical protein